MRASRIALVLLVLSILFASSLGHVGYAFGSGASYWHPTPTGLKPGDIVIGHGTLDWLIPGYWTHTGMIVGYSSSVGDWIVVESDTQGVHLSTLKEFLSRYDTVAVLRVATTDAVRLAAVSFALNQLGKPYDYYWLSKQVYGSSYYCSELVWASYRAAGGPDIDANPGWSWQYANGVAPQEIYDDGDTYVIYYHSS